MMPCINVGGSGNVSLSKNAAARLYPTPFVTARDNPQIHDSSRATNEVPQQSLCGLRAGLALAFQKIGKD
jgi:hypothetical protein